MEKGGHYRSKTLLLCSQGKGSNMSPLLHSRVYLWPWVTDPQEIKFLLCFTCLHNFSKPVRVTCHTMGSYIEIPPLLFIFSKSLLMVIIDSSFKIITQKKKLDACITKLLLFFKKNLIILLNAYSYIQLKILLLNACFWNTFSLKQPIQYNLFCCLQTYFCMCLSNPSWVGTIYGISGKIKARFWF